MTAISMFEDAMKYVMDEGWFDVASSLLAIAGCCNKELYALGRGIVLIIFCESHSWLKKSAWLKPVSLMKEAGNARILYSIRVLVHAP